MICKISYYSTFHLYFCHLSPHFPSRWRNQLKCGDHSEYSVVKQGEPSRLHSYHKLRMQTQLLWVACSSCQLEESDPELQIRPCAIGIYIGTPVDVLASTINLTLHYIPKFVPSTQNAGSTCAWWGQLGAISDGNTGIKTCFFKT